MALDFAHGAIQWLAADAATTVYTVSGLSFQPKALRFYWMGLQSATDATSQAVSERRGVGFAVSTSSRRCVGTFSSDTAATSDCGSFAADDCVVGTVDGTGARDGELDLNSITSDGFTLIVDDQGVANITVFWEAWGGSDITVAVVGDIAEPAATGTQNYTVTGFTGDGANQVVMFAGVQSTAALNTGAAADSGLQVGFASSTSAANQVTVCGNSDDASTAMDTDGYCQDGECLSMIVLAGGNPTARASLSAWGTDLFTLNWAARATTSRRNIFLAIKGGSWAVGAYTIAGNSASATATVSGLSFAPEGISVLGRMTAENTAATATANDRIGLGSGSSTSSRRSQGILDEDATASSAAELNHTVDYDSVLSFPSTAGALQSAYDIDAMNSDGFRIIVDTAGGVASEWQGYLAFGDQPAAALIYTMEVLYSGMLPTPFTPGQLPNLLIWLEADSIGGLVDNDPVTTWTDKTASAYAFTQGTGAAKPTYKTNIINGRPVVRFDGTDDVLEYAGHICNQSVGAIFAVVKSSNVAGPDAMFSWGDDGGTTNWFQFTFESVLKTYHNNVTTDGVNGNTSLVNDTFYIVQVISSGTAWTEGVDGTNQSLTVGAGSNSGDWGADSTGIDVTAVGGLRYNAALSQPWQGDIAALVVLSTEPTADQARNIRRYFARRYAKTVTS